MSRNARSLALISTIMMLCASLAIVQSPPVAYAAGTFIVNTTADAPDNNLGDSLCKTGSTVTFPGGSTAPACTLRAAIQQANASGGAITIAFAIPTSDSGYSIPFWTIKPVGSGLPPITAAGVSIDGPTSGAVPVIILDGSLAGEANGFDLQSANNVIRDMVILRFTSSPDTNTGNGIYINGPGAISNQVVGNYIGTIPGDTTTTNAGNQLAGVMIAGGATANRVGTFTTTGLQNNIGSNGFGVSISGVGTSGNWVQGNYIGRVLGSLFGTAPMPNTYHGISINDASNNIIGYETSGNQINIISSNTLHGIQITGIHATGNQVRGNYIGVDESGVTAAPNGQNGVHIFGAPLNTIAGSPAAPQIISGNTGYGVYLTGTGTMTNTVSGNLIGVNLNGALALGNGSDGVGIENNATNNLIGGAGAGNVISGNGGYGVSIGKLTIGFTDIYSNSVAGNLIGTNQTGTAGLSNTSGGVLVSTGARLTTIGGPSAAESNLIAYNGGNGITISSSTTLSTTIQQNVIKSNTGDGINVVDAKGLMIGGVPGEPLLISENTGNGIVMTNPQVVAIQYSTIEQNGSDGINISDGITTTLQSSTISQNGATGVRIAGEGTIVGCIAVDVCAAELGNIVQQNTDDGMLLSGNTTITVINNQILTNTVGLMAAGFATQNISYNTVRGNSSAGLGASGASQMTIANNTVTRNGDFGIGVANSDNVSFQANTANQNRGPGVEFTQVVSGTLLNTTARFNTGSGIRVANSTRLTIDSATLSRNGESGLLVISDTQALTLTSSTVYSNTVNGIQIGDGGAGPHPQRVRIMPTNQVSGNGITPTSDGSPVDAGQLGRGIVLSPATAEPGSASNPNHDIDPPLLSAMKVSVSTGQVSGRVDVSGSPSSCLPIKDLGGCTVHFFAANPVTQDGQGMQQIVPSSFTITANGYFTATLPSIPVQLVTMATDGAGNSSEYIVFTPSISLTISPPRTKVGAIPGQVINYQHTVANTGNIDLDAVTVTTASSLGANQWPTTINPSGAFKLSPGESRLVTVTLSLPTGSATNVRSGTIDKTTVTASATVNLGGQNITRSALVTDTTTVAAKVVLGISPSALNGEGPPSTLTPPNTIVIPYSHTITNNGNIATTVTIGASTDRASWPTTLSQSQIQLAPGASKQVTVQVTIPAGTQAGTVAKTTLTVTPTNPLDPTQVKSAVDTTTVTLQQLATMVANQTLDTKAGEMVTFQHVVTNLSNGEATFKLSATSSLGSTITFTSNTPGVTITNGNTFTISNAPGFNQFSFYANVTVPVQTFGGEQDSITVYLTDAQGTVIGGASVQDSINVVSGSMYPRLYLPLVYR